MPVSDSGKKENLTLHIAVCDDNIADRKQLERLLKRESDARAQKTGVFYIDSYGNANAVMKSPMLYDAFFIDMVSGDTDGICLTNNLINAGVTAPIILCISSINYRENIHIDPEKDFHNIFYLDKPLKKAELSDILDMCVESKSHNVTTIELRGENKTLYVTEDDIVSATTMGRYIHIFLKDGDKIEILSSLENFCSQLNSFTHYAALSHKTIINISYIKRATPFKITLTDGTEHRTTPVYYATIKKALQQFSEEPL